MSNKYYKLFSDCIIVKGASRSAVYDLTRKDYDFIPNSLSEILNNEIIDVKSLYKLVDKSSRSIIDEYISFLLEKEYVFEIEDISHAEYYPKIDLTFDYPSEISNAIIDYNGDLKLLENSIQQLDELNCNFLVLRFFRIVNIEELVAVLELFESLSIFSIEILLDYTFEFTEENLKMIVVNFPRLNRIVLFNSPSEMVINTYLSNGHGQIVFVARAYLKNEILKIQSEDSFVVSIKLFTESLSFNPFFNKKVYISESGEIKNVPFSKEIFGNVIQDKLSEVVNRKDFQKYWYVKKDDIKICKDCEYRYMCVDNRLPLNINEDNLWVLDGECAYNPYNVTWE